MMRIETCSASDTGAEVRLHVMPGGHMLCTVAGVDLRPTPAWLCRQVAIQAARTQLHHQEATCAAGSCGQTIPMSPDEDQLYREGLRLLQMSVPVVINLDYGLLHSREEGPS